MGYKIPKLTKNSQLSVIELTQILLYLTAIGLLSAHPSSDSQYFINVFWHRPAIANTRYGVLEGKRQREKEERRREKKGVKVEK